MSAEQGTIRCRIPEKTPQKRPCCGCLPPCGRQRHDGRSCFSECSNIEHFLPADHDRSHIPAAGATRPPRLICDPVLPCSAGPALRRGAGTVRRVPAAPGLPAGRQESAPHGSAPAPRKAQVPREPVRYDERLRSLPEPLSRHREKRGAGHAGGCPPLSMRLGQCPGSVRCRRQPPPAHADGAFASPQRA